MVSNLEEQMTKAIIQPLNPRAFIEEALRRALATNEKERENAKKHFEKARKNKPPIKS